MGLLRSVRVGWIDHIFLLFLVPEQYPVELIQWWLHVHTQHSLVALKLHSFDHKKQSNAVLTEHYNSFLWKNFLPAPTLLKYHPPTTVVVVACVKNENS